MLRSDKIQSQIIEAMSVVQIEHSTPAKLLNKIVTSLFRDTR